MAHRRACLRDRGGGFTFLQHLWGAAGALLSLYLVIGGATKICFVIAPGKSDILEYYGGSELGTAHISFAVQPQPRGWCDAIFRTALCFFLQIRRAPLRFPDARSSLKFLEVEFLRPPCICFKEPRHLLERVGVRLAFFGR